MSNIGGPIISPTDQITFSIDRLLQEDEHDEYSSSSYSTKNNNNNNAALLMSDEDEVFVPSCRKKKECDDTSSNTSSTPSSSSSSSSSIVRGRLHRGDRKKDLPPLAPKKKEKSTQEEGPSLLPAGAVVVPSASNNNNSNSMMMMNQPIHKLSPALLHTFNQVHVGNTAVQVGSSSSSSSTTAAAVTMFNNNNDTPAAAVTVIEINKASDFFSRAIAFAQTNDWDKVELVCDALAEKVKSMLLSEEINQGLNLRKEAIEFAQREFDAAFDARSKDIKRRHNALMIVAYLFAASGKIHKNNNNTNNNTDTTNNVSFPSIISEKIMVWALYRVLNNDNNKNENSTTTTQQPPLYALLSLAQGLDAASCYFGVNNNKGNNNNNKTNSSIGLQHLPVLVTKLCNGLVYAAPSKQQHETLCSSITKQTAILHRFNNSNNNNNMEAMKKQL